jgi:hypothetical protein
MHIVVAKNCMTLPETGVCICVTRACKLLCVTRCGKWTLGVTGEFWEGRVGVQQKTDLCFREKVYLGEL